MVETVLTIRRDLAVHGGVLGACVGLVVARLGSVGVVLTLPLLALVGFAAVFELRMRETSTAVLSFVACGAAMLWWLG